MIEFAVHFSLGFGLAFILIVWGVYLPRFFGPGHRIRRSADDPHQHCDRNPLRCSYARTIDRYRNALFLVADCHKCKGCADVANAALAVTYLPD